jgi:hypothetical protein
VRFILAGRTARQCLWPNADGTAAGDRRQGALLGLSCASFPHAASTSRQSLRICPLGHRHTATEVSRFYFPDLAQKEPSLLKKRPPASGRRKQPALKPLATSEGPIDLFGVGSCELAGRRSVPTPNRSIGISDFRKSTVGKYRHQKTKEIDLGRKRPFSRNICVCSTLCSYLVVPKFTS